MAKIDLNLVFLRSEDARIKLKDMAKYLKTTPQRLKYSIGVLEKELILKEPHCIFDYSYFGLIVFRVYFRGVYIGENDKTMIISRLKENPCIISINELTGEFDFVVEFAAVNPSRFNKELKRLVAVIPALNNYKVVLNLVTHICPKSYLLKNVSNVHYIESVASNDRIIGGDRHIEAPNKNEMSIIKALLEKPQLMMTELAKKAELNVKTAKSIINSLKKRNIIKGFRYIVDTNKLGITKMRFFLRLHNLSMEREGQLMNYMRMTKEIVQLNKTIGDWDMEVDIESMSSSRIRYIIMNFREEFKDIIEKFNLIECYENHKRAYLPLFIFKEDEQKA